MVKTLEVEWVVQVCRALSDIPEPILFVGPSELGLLASDPNSPEPRATEIVDEIIAALRIDPKFRNAATGHLANDAPGRIDVVLARIDAILNSA